VSALQETFEHEVRRVFEPRRPESAVGAGSTIFIRSRTAG
jgi:hypothetical protein